MELDESSQSVAGMELGESSQGADGREHNDSSQRAGRMELDETLQRAGRIELDETLQRAGRLELDETLQRAGRMEFGESSQRAGRMDLGESSQRADRMDLGESSQRVAGVELNEAIIESSQRVAGNELNEAIIESSQRVAGNELNESLQRAGRMELSKSSQRALLHLIGRFCAEEITFQKQVDVCATFTFLVDEEQQYHFSAEDVVRREDVPLYKELSAHMETQTSVEMEEQQYTDFTEPQRVKVEVETNRLEASLAGIGSDTTWDGIPIPAPRPPSKRGRKPKNKEAFACPLCPASFQDKEAIENHLKTFHDIGNQYKCAICDTECISTVDLMDHISLKHEELIGKSEKSGKKVPRSRKGAPKKALVGKTKSSSKSKKNVKKKKKRQDQTDDDGDDNHDGETFEEEDGSVEKKAPVVKKRAIADESFVPKSKTSAQAKCAECGKEYSSRRALRRHFTNIHDNREYQCEICGKNFNGKESLYHHKRGIHFDLKPYKCAEPGCNKAFNFNHSLRLHKLKHSGSRPHQCSDCGKTYLTAYHLKVHSQATHSERKQFSCSVCGKMFSYSTSLKMHEATHKVQTRQHCDQCDKTFVNRQALKYHIMSKHSEAGHHPCSECGKVYKTEVLLRAHMRRHTTAGSRYMCDLCGRQFMYKSALEMHSAIHKDEKSYACKVCGKMFKTYPTLYSHMYVHKEDSPYTCAECGKAFKTKERCKAHERRHSGLKPFECKLCHHCFPDNGGLSKHMKTVHCSVKKFVCDICGKATSRADNLRVHLKVHFKDESTIKKHQANVIRELKPDMPTVVPLTMQGTLLKKAKDKNSESATGDTSINSGSADSHSNQAHFGNMMFNQSIPNLPTMDSSQLSSSSDDLPLNLQNHSSTGPSAYQLTKLTARSAEELANNGSDSRDIPHGPESQENSTSQSMIPMSSAASMPPLQASPFMYSPFQGYVYTTGIQPPHSGAGGFFQ